MEHTRYSRVEPNSHSFTSLDNIIMTYEFTPQELTPYFLVVGFQNTVERGYELVFDKNRMAEVPPPHYFTTIKGIIDHISVQDNFDLEDFIYLITSTIKNGFNLKQTEKMERKEVYKLIDGERDYQDLKWDKRRSKDEVADKDKAVAEWLIYMEQHLNDAKRNVYHLNKEEALAQIRKVVTLGVRALEIHGCPERKIPT